MQKQTIAILFGGNSSEYLVSLESAYSLITHINMTKYNLYLIGITKEGKWFHYTNDIQHIENDTWWTFPLHEVMIHPNPQIHGVIELINTMWSIQHIDAFFPVLHGKNGEDGTVQGYIQLSQVPLIGCNLTSSAICMDKEKAHRLVKETGIFVPNSLVLSSQHDITLYSQQLKKLKYPLFVKPMKGGSSLGITKVYSESQLLEAIKKAFTYDNQVILEEEIIGFEVGCAIMGKDKLIIGKVDEIELSDGFFDFTEKYTLKTSQIHVPARISIELERKVQDVAQTIYQTLGCQIFARVDMFITPQEEIYFNEVNTIPGFTAHSRFPTMIKKLGITFECMIDQIIEMGLNNEQDNTL